MEPAILGILSGRLKVIFSPFIPEDVIIVHEKWKDKLQSSSENKVPEQGAK